MEKLAPFLFSSLLLALCGFCSLSLVPFSHLSFHFSPSSIDFQEMVNAKSGRWIKLNAGFCPDSLRPLCSLISCFANVLFLYLDLATQKNCLLCRLPSLGDLGVLDYISRFGLEHG